MARKVNEAKSQIKSQTSIKDGTVKDQLSKFPLLPQAKEKLLDSSLHENFQRVFHDVNIEILLCDIPWIWENNNTATQDHLLMSTLARSDRAQRVERSHPTLGTFESHH